LPTIPSSFLTDLIWAVFERFDGNFAEERAVHAGAVMSLGGLARL
jgi:hypothetical protein